MYTSIMKQTYCLTLVLFAIMVILIQTHGLWQLVKRVTMSDGSQYLREKTCCNQETSRVVNQLVISYDETVRAIWNNVVKEKVLSNDSELQYLIRRLLDPPSTHIIKPSMNRVVETPQSREVAEFLKYKRRGFFVECGAFDGERSSNTFHLEKYRDWEGLLIEPDPYYYTQLLGKARKAWSINACLSPFTFPSKMKFIEASGGMGSLVRTRSQSKTLNVTLEVPCFSLHSLLLAMNRTRVDYLSLDIEGTELSVLKALPFGEVRVDMVSVEHAHAGEEGRRAILRLMNSSGYRLHKDLRLRDEKQALFVDDYIFVMN